MALDGNNGMLGAISQLNAQMVAAKEAELTDDSKGLPRCNRELMEEKPAILAKLLVREGCLGVPGVLSHETCDRLRSYITDENARLRNLVTDLSSDPSDYFGEVYGRGTQKVVRQDMFLSGAEPLVRECLAESMTALLPLIRETVTMEGALHEISCFIGDSGSPRQCVHVDTIALPCTQYPDISMEPLYTIMVALQDVSDDMGHTVLYPRTHSAEMHTVWNMVQRRADTPEFLGRQQAVRSGLKKGDVSIFDSRLLHCGMANNEKPPDDRRVIFYFTLSKQKKWPLPGGLHGNNSIRKEDRWQHQVKDFVSTG